jgi:EAL domain-containing protein (putative c-di-GMP-specific phosphodiesterase class I)/GGDEF domain-containing protein
LEIPQEQELDDTLRRQMLSYGQRYDLQTGFLNHQAFQQSLAGWMRSKRDGREVALVWIEVLNLRREFAVLGSKGAESLVDQVAEALRGAVDAGALLSRYGARCFLVALEAERFDKTERHRIQAIADALSPIRVLGSHSMLEVAAGVAFWPADTELPEDLVRFASLAASRAGYLRSPSVLAFRSGMNHHVLRDHNLQMEMHRGFEQNQFRIVYQPQVELATGRVLGAEALIRWDHPEWGAVAPSEFIPVAEHSDLIQQILGFTLHTALEDARRWGKVGIELPAISANISWACLRRDDFVRSVRAVLAEIPQAATRLELEVTESVLFDDEKLFTARVRQLKAIGVRVAIDDFGTRYTGFNMLKQVPLDAMKIDRCFIHGIDRSPDMHALCRTIVAMARQLKLRTVAEGVERVEELNALRQIGCDEAQGYLFERPVPAEGFIRFLRAWPERMRNYGFIDVRTLPKAAAAGFGLLER